MKEPTLEDLQLPAVSGEVIESGNAPVQEEFSAYMHTYLFGPQDRVVHTEGEPGERKGTIYAVAGMYCMFNDGNEGNTTMYFVLPISGESEKDKGKWVYQDTLMQGLEGWTVLPRN